MASENDDHLRWLVESRSQNQQVTLQLYLTIKNNAEIIERDLRYAQLAQELAAVAFSLWRAVFLSDLTQEVENQMIDVKKFLETLIRHNAIAYQQDLISREWTFQYYLENARMRLLELARYYPGILDVQDLATEAISAKDDWMIAHNVLSKAVERFAEATK